MVRTTIATIVTTRAQIEYPQNPKETAETVLTLPFPSLDMFSLFFLYNIYYINAEKQLGQQLLATLLRARLPKPCAPRMLSEQIREC